MTALVTKHLPLVAGAPDGIKKLRTLILNLAVRGKLVAQETGDQSASVLLRQIADEKAKLTALWGIRREPPQPKVSDAECPHALPTSWSWVRLPELYITIPVRGNQLLSSEVAEDGLYPVVDQGKRFIAGFTNNAELLIKLPGPVVVFGDHTTERKYIDFDFVAGADGVKVLRPVCVYERFFWWQLKSLNLEDRGYARHFKVLNSCLFALPPLAEQHRIVAKVDELMALCDRLEADQADAEAAHAQLVQALLDSLTQATDAADFRASWQRLSEHFHTLFTTEASIDALKQTVLQLAVMGRLVLQDPADESPSVLLERIANELANETLSNGSNKSRKYTEVEPAEQYVNTPSSWIWTRLGSQVLGSGAGWSPSCEARPRVNDEWGVLKVSAVSWGEFRPEENKALPANLEARPEHEVHAGDFLVSRANTAELVARSVVVESTPSRLMLSDKIVRFRLTKHCNRRYINLVNSSSFARSYYGVMAGGTSSSMKNVTREQILNLPLPLPPLAEQHRIVAKIDELMALCDQLKAQLAEARQQHAQLATALVEQAVA